MDELDREFLADATASPSGRIRILDVERMLISHVEKNSFNFDRAEQMYKMALDHVVLEALGSVRALHKKMIPDSIRWEYSRELTRAFAAKLGITKNQRPTRRGLFSLLAGK